MHVVRSVGVGWGLFTVLACQSFSERNRQQDEGNALDREIELALDIEVQIQLDAQVELGALPSELIDVDPEPGSGLELDEERVVDESIEFTIRGTKVGLHRLVIAYEDEDGKRQRETFVVSVKEIDRSHVSAVCVDVQTQNAVPVGAEFRVDGAAYDSDDNRLAIGDLSVVKDADGFELVDAARELWRAPETPGRYTWRLLGKNSERIEWIVYDPSSSIPKLEVATRSSSERASVSVDLTPAYEGQPLNACILPSNSYVTLEVVQGNCRPAVGGVAFDDSLSLALPTPKGTFWVAGAGNCRLKASSPSGTSTETSLNVDVKPESFSDWDYVELTDEPVQLDLRPEESVVSDRLLRTCPNDSPIFTSGANCPSGFHSNKGCIERTHWKLDYVKLAPEVDYVGVGTGLLAELEIYLRVEHESILDDDVVMLPNFMHFSPRTSELEFIDLGCTRDRHIVQVTSLETGEHEVKLTADDTTHGGHTHTVRAFEVARTSLEPIPKVVDVSETVADVLAGETAAEEARPRPASVEQTDTASVRHTFAGEQHAYRVSYFDVSNEPLHGVGVVSVTSSEGDAGARVARLPDRSGFGIFVGNGPTLVEVSSPHAPDSHRIYVEDQQAITSIEGLELVHVSVGEIYCVELYPLAEDGLLIDGHAPAPPVVKGTTAVFHAFEQDSKACFVAHSPGQADLEWTWGNAEQSLSWFAD